MVSRLHAHQSRWQLRDQASYRFYGGSLLWENVFLITLEETFVRRLVGQIRAPNRWDAQRWEVLILDADIVT
jgi:hypothetical protein